MKPCAALLIDLENFYHSRCDYFADLNLPTNQQPEFGADLALLIRYAEKMAELPLAVRRAYANFNTLQITPRELMRQGVEPVQVFCLSEATNKNAADMKLAMDAVALASTGPFEQFVIVTGDADFIPVILELKRRGLGVSAIAVTGSTSPLIKSFVDKFKRFEDIGSKLAAPRPRATRTLSPVAAPGAPPTPMGPNDLPQVAAAIQRILDRGCPIRIDKIHRELSRELGYSFDPTVFACSTNSLFIRRNAAALGVVVDRGPHNELFINRLQEPTSAPGDTELVREQVDRQAGAALAAPEPAPAAVTQLAPGHPPVRVEAGHTPAAYRNLLKTRGPLGSAEPEHQSINPPPWPSLARVCDDTFTVLSPTTGHADLPTAQYLERLYTSEKDTPFTNYRSHVRRAVAVLKLSNAVLETDGRVGLHPEVTEPADVRWAVLGIMLSVLAVRLKENQVPGPIRAGAFVTAIAAGPMTDELVPLIAQAVESVERAAAGIEAQQPQEPSPALDILAPAGEPPSLGDTPPAEAENPFAASGFCTGQNLAGPEAARGGFPKPHPTHENNSSIAEPLRALAVPANLRLESAAELVTEPEQGAHETASSGVIDIAALTRAAVASVAEPVVSVVPVETFAALQAPRPEPALFVHGDSDAVVTNEIPEPVLTDEAKESAADRTATGELGSMPGGVRAAEAVPAEQPAQEHTFGVALVEPPPVDLTPEPVVEVAPPAAESAPQELVVQEDEYPLAIPVADWLPDDEAFAATRMFAGATRPGADTSAAHLPFPADTNAQAAKITLLPPDCAQPLPPLPPGSA